MQLIYCKFYYTTYHLIYTLYLEDNRIVGNKSSNLLHSITQLAHSDKLEKNHIPPIDPVLYIFTQEGGHDDSFSFICNLWLCIRLIIQWIEMFHFNMNKSTHTLICYNYLNVIIPKSVFSCFWIQITEYKYSIPGWDDIETSYTWIYKWHVLLKYSFIVLEYTVVQNIFCYGHQWTIFLNPALLLVWNVYDACVYS